MLVVLLGLLCVGQAMGQTSAPPPCKDNIEFHERLWRVYGTFGLEDTCGAEHLIVSVATAGEVLLRKMDRSSKLRYIIIFEEPTPHPVITRIALDSRVLCASEVPNRNGYQVRQLTRPIPKGSRRKCLPSNAASGSVSTMGPRGTSASPSNSMPATPVAPGPPAWEPTERPLPQPQRPTSHHSTRKPSSLKPSSTELPAVEGQFKDECGLSIRPQELRYGPDEVKKGDWPWVAPIHNIKTTKFMCAGVLISKRFVVVAAHCLHEETQKTPMNLKDLVVIMGKFNFSQWAERDLQPRQIRKMMIHPEFRRNTLQNDIALLYLDEDVEFTMYARPICLWDEGGSTDALVNEEATLVGWNSGEFTPRLATVPIVSRQQCLETRQLRKNTFCAGNLTASKDCIGNGDGGLLIPRTGADSAYRWFLRGIPSNHLQNDLETCRRGGFVVYTDIVPFMPWIRELMRTTRPYND